MTVETENLGNQQDGNSEISQIIGNISGLEGISADQFIAQRNAGDADFLAAISAALSPLTAQEKAIVRLELDQVPKDQIAALLRLSPDDISRIHTEAVDNLKTNGAKPQDLNPPRPSVAYFTESQVEAKQPSPVKQEGATPQPAPNAEDKVVLRAKTARETLIAIQHSPRWSFLSFESKKAIMEILAQSESLNTASGQIPEQLPNLRIDTAILQIRQALGQFTPSQKDAAQPPGEPESVETPLQPIAAPEVETSRTKRPYHRRSESIQPVDLESKTNEELFSLVLQGRVARQALVSSKKSTDNPIVQESAQLRGYVALPPRGSKTKVKDAAPIINTAILANQLLASRLREAAVKSLGPEYVNQKQEFSQVVEESVAQAIVNFKPDSAISIEASVGKYLDPLIKLIAKDTSGTENGRVQTLPQLLNSLGLSQSAFNQLRLSEGLQFEQVGNLTIVSPHTQETISARYAQFLNERRAWDEQIKSASIQIRVVEDPGKQVPIPPEGSKTIAEFATALGISVPNFYQRKLSQGLQLKRYGRSLYLTPQEQEAAKQKLEQRSTSAKRGGPKEARPDGSIRLSEFLKRNNVSPYIFHHHNLGEGVVKKRRGASPIISPQQQETLDKAIQKHRQNKVGTSAKVKTSLPQGAQTLKDFVKDLQISLQVYYQRKLGQGFTPSRLDHNAYLTPEQQERVRARIETYRQNKAEKKPKVKPHQLPQGTVRLKDFLKGFNVSIAAYKRENLGDGLSLTFYRRSPHLSVEDQEILKGKIASYLESKRQPKREPKSKIPQGYVRLSVFLKANEISSYVFDHYKMGAEIVAIRQGVSPLISPQHQELLKLIIRNYREAKARGKVKTAKSTIPEGYVKRRDFMKSQGISEGFWNKYELGKNLAQQRGIKILLTLSPQDQEIISQRYEEIIRRQRAEKAAKQERQSARISERKEYTHIRDFIALLPHAKNLNAASFKDHYEDPAGRLHQNIASYLERLTKTERTIVELFLQGMMPREISVLTKTGVAKINIVKEIAVERLAMLQDEHQIFAARTIVEPKEAKAAQNDLHLIKKAAQVAFIRLVQIAEELPEIDSQKQPLLQMVEQLAANSIFKYSPASEKDLGPEYYLSTEEIMEAVQKGQEAITQIINANLALVPFTLKQKMRQSNDPLWKEELIAAGNEGLTQAAASYDIDKGITFASFAVRRISGSILDHIRKHDALPRSVRTALRIIEGRSDQFIMEKGYSPTVAELSEITGLTEEKVREAQNLQRSSNTLSISFEQIDDHGELFEEDSQKTHPRSTLGIPDDELEVKETIRELGDVVNKFPPRDRAIIHLRYVEDLPFHEIGDRLNLSESRVCQLHNRILKRLKVGLQN